ncbi:MAG: glycosyltransferase family 39 protein [bacterium]|nr:glycosyltransferase family 39 protein [bacterium]MDD4153068.1 glycosyltransferase family 39 protein [bacterium]
MHDIAAFTALIIASFGPGFLITEHLLGKKMPDLATVVYSSAIGFGVFIYILLGMSYAGIMTAGAIHTAMLILLALTFLLIARRVIEIRKHKPIDIKNGSRCRELLSKIGSYDLRSLHCDQYSIFVGCAALFLVMAIALNFLAALSPSLYWDELSYHLPLARDYLTHGHMISYKYIPHSYMPEGAELLFSAGMALSSDKVPNLIHFYFGLLLAAAIIAFAVRAGRPGAGVIGASFFYNMPVVTWLSSLAYIDLIAGAFAFLALLAAISANEDASAGNWLLCGLLSGFCVSVKYSAGIFPALIFLFLLFKWLRHRTHAGLISLLSFSMPAVMLTLPWMARSYFLTGTPLWPYLSSIIPNPFIAREAEAFRNTFTAFSQASRTLAGFLLLPFNALFASRQFDAAIGPVLPAFLPGYFILRQARLSSVNKMLVFALLFTAIWYFSGPQMRFALPALAVFSLAAGLAASTLLKRVSLKTIAGVILLLALTTSFFYAGHYSRERAQLARPDKVRIGLGLIDDESYYNCLDIYRVASYANAHARPEERILAINENRGYFFKNEFIWMADWLLIQGLRSLPDIDYLIKKDIKWIMVTGTPAAEIKWLDNGINSGRLKPACLYGSAALFHILE